MLMSRFPPFVFNAPSIFPEFVTCQIRCIMRFCKNVLVDVCVQECSVHTNCNREVIAVMMTILLYELLADIAFSEMRRRWCQHVSVCWSSIMIEVHQNQSGLHAAVLLTVRPSCLDHAMSSSKVSHHCRGDTDFLQRYQLFLSSAFHFISLHSIEKLIGSSQTETRPQLPERSPPECTHLRCSFPARSTPALDTSASSSVCLSHWSSLGWLFFKRDRSLFSRRFHRHSHFQGSVVVHCSAFVQWVRAGRLSVLSLASLGCSCCSVSFTYPSGALD